VAAVSRPRSLELPPGARATRLVTTRRDLAALVATPAAGEDGWPALLVPGFTGSKEDFLALLEPLAASGRRVVSIDQRGQYQSPGADDREAYALGELGQDVLAAADALGGRVHLVGHSFGGYVARTAVALDGARPRIASLTLMDSGPGRVTDAAALADLALLTTALPEHDMETIWQRKLELERRLGEPVSAPDIEAFLHARFVQTHPVALAVAAEQLLADEDRLVDLRARTVPLLVVTGAAEDVWSAAELTAMADQLGAPCVVIAGAGHSPAVERPEATAAALVSFWDGVEAEVTRSA
jgi:pimeloyl-ACP methyl ester carboxylesterase